MTASSIQTAREIRVASVSHIGASTKRTLLEDRCRVEKITTAGGLEMTVGVVADGIGGENAGERAAEITVNAIVEHCAHSVGRDIPSMLEEAMTVANQQVFADARRSRRKMNMGSTAAAAAIVNHHLYIANVGDSRIYLIRGKRVLRLTMDHTWENEILRSGKLTVDEVARHPRKDEIVRSIGYDAVLNVDLGLWLQGGKEDEAAARAAQGFPLKPGDQVVICSDGLTKTRHDHPSTHYVEERELANLTVGRSPKQAADLLVKRALNRKVDDNVSVVILAVPGGLRIPRTFLPALAVAAGVLFLIVAGVWLLPRLIRPADSPSAGPTIPPLPSGVSFVSELEGRAEVVSPGGGRRSLHAEDLIASGEGVSVVVYGSDSYARLGLADENIVYIGPDTQVELLAIADGIDTQQTVLVIERGVILVACGAGGMSTLIVRSPSGTAARSKVAVMGLIFSPEDQRFDVDCFHGLCEVVDDISGELGDVLDGGQHLWVSMAGEVSPPDPTRNQLYAFGGYGGGLVLTPTVALATSTPASMPATSTRTPLGPLFVPPSATRTSPPPRDTSTPKPTKTMTVTRTPVPTNTPIPTKTSVPTVTQTPKKKPTDTPVSNGD